MAGCLGSEELGPRLCRSAGRQSPLPAAGPVEIQRPLGSVAVAWLTRRPAL